LVFSHEPALGAGLSTLGAASRVEKGQKLLRIALGARPLRWAREAAQKFHFLLFCFQTKPSQVLMYFPLFYAQKHQISFLKSLE
jgi:hypothetical protein